MNPKHAILIAAVAALSLAGCTGPAGTADDALPTDDAPVIDPDWALNALQFDDGHDHANPVHHENLTTPNFKIVGHNPLVSPDRGVTNYYYPCGDAKDTTDGRQLAIIESGTDVAFAIADVTDPTAPEFLGELVMRTTDPYDVALVDNGNYVAMVTSLPKTPDEGEPVDRRGALVWDSPCNPGPVPVMDATQGPLDEFTPRPNQLLLISIADPANPVVIDQRPLSGVGHGVYSTVVDGRTWVATAMYGAVNALGTYQFYEIIQGATTPVLSYLSTYHIPPSTDTDDLTRNMGHNDVWIHKHPVTGQVLAWMAHWHHGIMVVDLTNPRMPTQIAHWNDYDPARPGSTGGFHSIWVFEEMWGDRQFVMTGPELGSHPPDQPTGTFWVLDATDPTALDPVGAWTLPHDVEWTQGAEWSGHYMTVVNQTAFATMYHGGVWAIDLSGIPDQDFHSLPSAGVFVPHLTSPRPDPSASPWAPILGEVHPFDDGTLVTFDAGSGLYAFTFDEAMSLPAPEPWPIEPVAGR